MTLASFQHWAQMLPDLLCMQTLHYKVLVWTSKLSLWRLTWSQRTNSPKPFSKVSCQWSNKTKQMILCFILKLFGRASPKFLKSEEYLCSLKKKLEMTTRREGQPHSPYVCLFATTPCESLLFGIGKSYSLSLKQLRRKGKILFLDWMCLYKNCDHFLFWITSWIMFHIVLVLNTFFITPSTSKS